MEQVTSVTGSRHNRSTTRSRAAARTRAARLGAFETAALKATSGARVRISSARKTASLAAPYVAATGLLLVGSLNWK
jgi:hypothetical protein